MIEMFFGLRRVKIALFLCLVGWLGLGIHFGVDDSITKGSLPIFWTLSMVPPLFLLMNIFTLMKR